MSHDASEPKQHLRVVIVSPSDVAPERRAILEIIRDINSGIADELNFHLNCYRWETDVYPQFHAEGPQGAIDTALQIKQSDIVIGLFWKRFGSPVRDARSGTEHELRIAYEEWKRDRKPRRPVIMLYFKTEPFTPRTVEDGEQIRRVLEFKATFAQQAVYSDVEDIESFSRKLQNDLTQLLKANLDLSESVERRIVQPERRTAVAWNTLRLEDVPLYTFSGLQREAQAVAIFQDFRVDPDRYKNPNPVTHLWADVYRGCAISAAVEESDPPHLNVTFENHPGSWPCNLTLRPLEERAVLTSGKSEIAFEVRVDPTTVAAGMLKEVAIAIRIINGWY
jgi:hypothetical protein